MTMLPFSAVVGFGMARRALLCTLVDPTLRGVVVSGPIGTGKSALMRSFAGFVRERIDPDAPFVQVPLGVGEDRLLGGVDIDASLTAGAVRTREGLLAEADGGFLFVDDLPLLDELAIATIVRTLETESVAVEREGISALETSRFVLVATTVPTERDVSLGVADRVAFLIGAEESSHDSSRLVLRRNERLHHDPEGLLAHFAPHEQRLAEGVATARVLHPFIELDEASLATIAATSQRMAIAGNRADLFAAKAARAHAALRGSRSIEEEDVEFAIASVLAPRAQNIPHEESGGDDEGNEGGEREGPDAAGTPPPPSPAGRDASGEQAAGEPDEIEAEPQSAAEGSGAGSERAQEQVFEGVDFTLPLPSLAEFFATRRSVAAGQHGVMQQWRRGRHTRSMQGEPSGRRIAIGATLRAAAPHQRARGRDAGDERIIVRGDDIRIKRFTQRSGTLFIFCVDASGSMAANRMREAKGAVARLLQEAYVNRDTVALIAFRGREAELLLPPTSSVERAKRSLDVLPTGGGTPLASALMKAYALVELARRRDVEQAIVVLLTDGRANVPMAENAAGMIMEVRRQHVRRELESVAVAYRRGGVRALVVDTRQSYGESSEAVRLAELLGARHFFLPRLDARRLVDVVRSEIATSRSSR
jgi:magnesium chelatase subunit D